MLKKGTLFSVTWDEIGQNQVLSVAVPVKKNRQFVLLDITKSNVELRI